MSTPPTGRGPTRTAANDATLLLARVLAAPEGRGSTIDRYQLIEEIGAGGFGSVFLAEQIEPVERQVALKIIKLGMDTGQVIARFEQERQTLALMDHPHIAKVLDAGTTDAGRPYFVMELVSGEPITAFCDAHGLSVRERLELFVQVCNAIQHAHQKGIIHRDIKPSNVLVSMHDGRPHAKVIDFGIAKAIEPFGAETMHTRVGQWIGTPFYMSPEQSVGSLDVDTRSDVYSLGVLLYELLTGTTPFAASSDGDLLDLRAPTPPSRGRSSPSLGAGLDLDATLCRTSPRARSTEPRRLLSLLRGELDWITMKAIEKEPRAPLPDRERLRPRHRALPRRRAGGGGAPERQLSPAQARGPASRRGAGGDGGDAGAGRRSRRAPCGRRALPPPSGTWRARKRRAPPPSTTSCGRCSPHRTRKCRARAIRRSPRSSPGPRRAPPER